MAVVLEKVYKVTFTFALVDDYNLEKQTWLTREMLKSRLKRSIVKYFDNAESAQCEQMTADEPLIVTKHIQLILTFEHENQYYEIAPSNLIHLSDHTTQQTVESSYL